MPEFGFCPTCIFPNKDRIGDFILLQENTVQRKTRILAYFMQCYLDYLQPNGKTFILYETLRINYL